MSHIDTAALSAFFHPHVFEALTSTNDEAKARAESGAPEGTLIVAETQTSGRGRMGRTFDSPAGNLYMSLLLRPQRSAMELARLSFLTAVALGEAILAVLPDADVALKWPNDVLLQGRKISGILLESASDSGWLVIGVGVNIVSSPAHLGRAAISLREAGWQDADRDTFLSRYAGELERWYGVWLKDGFEPIRQAWLQRAAYRGQTIEVRLPKYQFRGTFADLDHDGTLIVVTEDGGRRQIGAGEIFRVEE